MWLKQWHLGPHSRHAHRKSFKELSEFSTWSTYEHRTKAFSFDIKILKIPQFNLIYNIKTNWRGNTFFLKYVINISLKKCKGCHNSTQDVYKNKARDNTWK